MRGTVLTRLSPGVEVAGRSRVNVDRLIVPLRYDILVRQNFFGFLATATTESRSTSQIVEASRAQDYYQWFRHIVVPRYEAELVGDDAAIDAAFAIRVRRSIELLGSFEANGYDPRRPVVLRGGLTLRSHGVGHCSTARVFAGDGCHRLALLRSRGCRELRPDMYRVRWHLGLNPIDNTRHLVNLLGVNAADYRDFVAMAYARVAVDELLADIEKVDEAHCTVLADIARGENSLLAQTDALSND
jgi:hypothetical protein